MKNKIVLIVIETVFFCGLLYFLIVNYMQKTTAGVAVSADNTGYVVASTFVVILIAYLVGVFSGFVYSLVLGQRYKDQIEFYARKNEKLAVQNEIDTDDKEALQRKIATLEIALNNALKNK
ncbi:MAG: hypothetical protein IJY61_00230 [Candidatus Gastranaerophilales bacterium]|nr:hypothetical protein [Candidatus Gastranaerophilales bacterium]